MTLEARAPRATHGIGRLWPRRSAHPSMPTRVRYLVLLAATISSLVLYLHRMCIAELLKSNAVQNDLGLDARQVGQTFSAFFWAYALAQVPSGWISDRFGARWAMTFYIASWSLLAGLVGLVDGFVMLLALRLGLGLAQAGAYPTCGGILRQWMPLAMRGRASSIVAAGGRVGGAIAPLLTAVLIDWTSWRGTMIGYGLVGLATAAVFAALVRNSPREHPWVDDAERLAIDGAADMVSAASDRARASVPWRGLLTSRSMWLISLSQFMTNVGWIFLVTYLTFYLKHDLRADDRTGGAIVTTVLSIGIVGMLYGGWLTDLAMRRFGIRWGRSLPLAASRFLAASAYVVSLWLDTPWTAAAAFAVVAMATDLGTGATWSFAQDVGGRNVGAVLGWGNMWGNLGAAVAPLAMAEIIGTLDGEGRWAAAIMVCAAAFVISGVAALGADASKKIA